MYSLPNLNQSGVSCLVLTVASWPAYGFCRRQVRGSGIPISWRISHSLLWSTQKGFGIFSEAEIDAFLELSCFFYYQMHVGNLISGSSAFSKSSLYIWKFLVQVLLKPSMENFEHYFASMWIKGNYVVVWAFFPIYLIAYRQIKWIKDVNVRTDTIEHLEESIDRTLFDINTARSFLTYC